MNIGEWNLKLAQAEAEIQRLNRFIETQASEKKDQASNLILQEKYRTQIEDYRNQIRRNQEQSQQASEELRKQLEHSKMQLSHMQQEMKKKNELIQSYETQNLTLTRQLHAKKLAYQNATGTELFKIEQKVRDHWTDKENKLMSTIRKMKKQFEVRFQILTQYENKLANVLSRQAVFIKELRTEEKNVEQLKFTKRQLVTEVHDLRQERDLYSASMNDRRRRNRRDENIT